MPAFDLIVLGENAGAKRTKSANPATIEPEIEAS
jgi:hypothetical protein